MIDALRSYLQLASGLAEVSATKAKEAAASLAAQGPDMTPPNPDALTNGLQTIAEDLVEQGRTNTDIIVGLVKTEVDRAVGRMGFVREEELAAVRRHVQRLEDQLTSRSGQAAEAAVSAATVGAKSAAATAKTAAGAAAAVARTAPKLGASTRAPAPAPTIRAVRTTQPKKANPRPSSSDSPAPVKKVAVKKAPVKKAPAKKAPAKKSATKKAAVKKAPAKKAAVTTTVAAEAPAAE